jgi:AraC family transcriptional regulator
MNPYIIEIAPFTVAGWIIRIKLPKVNRHADIPAFSYSYIYESEDNKQLSNKTYSLKKHFAKSNAIKHCEIYLCYDADPSNGEFNYFFGRGIFHPDDINNILPDIMTVEISGLYAIFSSPLVPVEQQENMEQIRKDLWNDIMFKWLPDSEFEYDETRKDFEHYDLRSHGQFFGGKKQMDIYIPIRQREKAYQEAVKKGLVF